tara:strand:+ start:1665 stop:2147 length:483 start_codon:yes stop_codon:yes gene_type:complete
MINNINSYDLLLLTNKEYCKHIHENNDSFINITNDAIYYKKQIKNKINKLLDSYVDSSVNINKLNNNTTKYKNHFHYFLISLIDYLKYEEMKKLIFNDLSGVTNHNININTYDLSNNNIINLDKTLINYKNKKDKINNLNNFVNKKNKNNKNIILPRKRL